MNELLDWILMLVHLDSKCIGQGLIIEAVSLGNTHIQIVAYAFLNLGRPYTVHCLPI